MASTSREAGEEMSMEWQDMEGDFLTAIKKGNIFDVYKTIKIDEKRQIINNKNSSGERGIDIAWEKEYYDIVLLLLLADCSFPVKFEYKEHTGHPPLKTLIMHVAKWKSGLHQEIIGGNLEKVKRSIKAGDIMIECYLSKLKNTISARSGNNEVCEFELKYFKPKHYFNYSSASATALENDKSASATALESEKYDIFAYLKSVKISLTDIENENIFKQLDDKKREKITESINKFSSPMHDAHIFYLMSITESFPSNESVTEEREFKNKVFWLFKKLDEISQISIIMKYLHRCDAFKINVDLYNELTCEMDLTNPNNLGSTYYLKRRIYVGLGPKLSIGTLAHELTHLAMYEMFQNGGKPYEKNDLNEEFLQQIDDAREKLNKLNINELEEETIKIIDIFQIGFNLYKESEVAAEIIARISEVLAIHKEYGKTVIDSYFNDLFSFFNKKIKELENNTAKMKSKRSSRDLKFLNRVAPCSKKFHEFQLNNRVDSYGKDYENKLRELINSNNSWELFLKKNCNEFLFLYSYLKKIKKELLPDEFYIFTIEFCNANLDDFTAAFYASDADLFFILITPNEKSEKQNQEVFEHFLFSFFNSHKKIIFLICGDETDTIRTAFANAFLNFQDSRKEIIESFCKKSHKDFEQTWKKEISVLKNFQQKFDAKFNLKCLQFSTKQQLSFFNFHVDSQNQLLQKNKIILQGNPTSLRELLCITDAKELAGNDLKLVENLEPGVIEKIIHDKNVIVGRNLPPFDCDFYETRNFKKVLIKRSIETKESLYDILCYSKENFKKSCSEYPSKNVHWLEEESKSLIWQKTSGSIKYLSKFRQRLHPKKILFYSESDLFNLQTNLKIILISNVAGMGKTTLLSHLCQVLRELSGNCVWIFKLDLKFYNETLCTNQMNVEDLAYFMLNLHDKPLDKALFDNGKIKTVILFDGFDEVQKSSQKLLLDVIQYLEKKVTNIWLTTRDDMRSDLENKFGVFSISLKPISDNEVQAEFLNKIWRSKFKKEGFNFMESKLKLFSKDLITIFCEDTAIISDDKFLSLPLHLKMISEIFYEKNNESPKDLEYVKGFIESKNKKPSLRKTLDVLDLYQTFLKKTIYDHHFKNKMNIDIYQATKMYDCYYESFIFKCKMLALKIIIANPENLALFPVNHDKLKEFEQEILDSSENLGLVYKHSVEKDGKGVLSFLHLTYAEYLSSEFIAKHLVKVSLSLEPEIYNILACIDETLLNTTLLFIKNVWKILKKEDFFTKVKSGNFLNLAAQNGFLNIFKAIHEGKFENPEEKNETGKNAVILAAEFGKLKIVEYVLNTVKADALKNFVNTKDETNHTALSYAIIKHHFQIGYDLLIHGADCNELNDCENTHSFVQFVCEISLKKTKIPENDKYQLVNILEKLLEKFPDSYKNSNEESNSYLCQLFCSFLWHGRKLVFECLLKCIPSIVIKRVLNCRCCGEYCIVKAICSSLYLSEDEKIGTLENISEYVQFQNFEFMEATVRLGLFKVFSHFINQNEALPDTFLKTTFKYSHFVFAYYLLNKLSFECENPLYSAITSNASLKLVKYVYDMKTDPKLKNDQLLSQLSNKNNCYMLTFFINQGIFHNLMPDSKTLEISKNSDFIKILSECGAEIYDDRIIISEDISLGIHFTFENSMDLIYSIKNENFEWSKFIICYGGDINQVDQDGKTALHWACRVNNIEIVQLLLQYGARFDMKDNNGLTPLNELISFSSYYSLLQNDREKIKVQILMKYFKLLQKNFYSKEPLNFAEYENSWCFLNARNANKSTLLHVAVENHNLKTVKKILDLNKECLKENLKWQLLKDKSCELYKNYQPLSVDAEDINGNSPLHIACKKNKKLIIKRLLEEGAIFNCKNKSGKTPENLAKTAKHILTSIKNCFEDIESRKTLNLREIPKLISVKNRDGVSFCVKNRDGETLLHCIVRHKLQKLFECLLMKGIDLNCQNLLGYTPLHLAAKDNNIDMVKGLLRRGAFFNIVSTECKTPLELAKNVRDSDTFKSLNLINEMYQIVLSEKPERIVNHIKSVRACSLSVPLSMIVNAFDRTGHCAIHYAAKFSYTSVVKLLLENGAIYNCKNRFGKSPMDITSSLQIKRLLQLIHNLFLMDVELFDKIKNEIGFKIVNNVRNEMGLTLLHSAAIKGNKTLFIKLIKSGADVKTQNIYGKRIKDNAKNDIKKIVGKYLQMQEYIHKVRISEAEKLWKNIYKFYKSDSTRNQNNSSNYVSSPPRAKKPRIADLQEIKLDEKLLFQLTDMGISENGSKRALYHTQNKGIHKCLNWIVEHLNDKDFDEPLNLPGLEADDSDAAEVHEAIVMMGFHSDQANAALDRKGNNLEEAVDWIFSQSHSIIRCIY